MLRAGALFVAVTISFVIAVLISLLITLAFHYKIQNRESLLQKKLERNASSAITLLINDSVLVEEIKFIDLYGEGSDSVLIKKYSWGVYEVATVKAFFGKYQLAKTVEYGYKPDESISGAVYLSDLNKPLYLYGKTKIVGTCYLPEASVRRGTGGKDFEGSTLIKGTIKNSNNSLPVLNKGVIKKIAGVFGVDQFQIGLYREVSLNDSLVNSFHDTTLLVKVSGDLNLSGKYLSGNIIVYSDQSIYIDASTKLEDVILFADAIKITKGFIGNIQAFVTDSLVVEENCKLNYPSALGLFKKDYKTPQPFIKLMKNSELKGIIFTCQSESVSDQKQTLIIIETGAIVHGQIYADGFAEIKGELDGMVWCNGFYLDKSPLPNSLLDAVIDYTKLSSYYAGSGLIASGKIKKIIKWLE